MKKKSIKPILLKLPYLAFVYLFDKLTQAIRLSLRDDVMETLLAMGEGFAEAFDEKGHRLACRDNGHAGAGNLWIRLLCGAGWG